MCLIKDKYVGQLHTSSGNGTGNSALIGLKNLYSQKAVDKNALNVRFSYASSASRVGGPDSGTLRNLACYFHSRDIRSPECLNPSIA